MSPRFLFVYMVLWYNVTPGSGNTKMRSSILSNWGGGSQVPEHNKLKNKIIYVLRHSRPDPQTLRRRIAATGLVFGPTMSCRS